MTTEQPARTPLDAGTPTRVWLVALLTVVTLEMVRASGPLLDRAFAVGTFEAALAAFGAYAGAGLVVALVLAIGRRTTGTPDARTLLIGSALLAVLRILIQGLDGIALNVVGLLTVAVAVGVLTLAVAFVAGRPSGGRQAAVGLVLGCGLSIGLQLLLGTWDALWQPGWSGWVLAVVVGGLLLATARGLAAFTTADTEPTGRPRRLWALGPFLAIAATIVANPAFAASQSGSSLRTAGIVVVAGNLVGAGLLLRPTQWSARWRVGAAVLVVVGVGCALWLTGVGALVAITVLEICIGVVLSAAFSAHRPAPRGLSRTAAAALVVGVLTIAPLLVYMLDYDLPLPVDNAWVLVGTALALALSGLRRRTPPVGTATYTPSTMYSTDRLPRSMASVRLLVLPTLVVATIGLVALSTPTVPARAGSDTLTLVDWNLHYGVSPLTGVDLEDIAATIEAQHPDVVTLQEVERGWIFGGGADMATWLSRRLGMTIHFAPAADRQFGNAVLSRSHLTQVAIHDLPYGAGPQDRSALATTVTTASGVPLRVTSVHLQHRASNTPTRLDQLHALASAEPVAPPAVLAGDLNAAPGSPEIALLTDAGWTSAIDEVGDPSAKTSTSLDPTQRIDWIFGQGVTFESAHVLTGHTESDHLPLVARFRTPG
ncbi:endonuclease/exonuclease/phosphatase family protein [Cellulomonas sp. URHD0024]|uniref:endonuclease/exonuclease/phosphatase family protein n=1 Tax=Cellulomonas sp. URHD0024 TaxID=1302620 RepID=UPI000410BAED|nr:endonuclease/exonuclease/phosphatase family protein [Cellulomonas sp. URHD0024]